MNDTETLPGKPEYAADNRNIISKVCIILLAIFNIFLCVIEGFTILFTGPVLARMYTDAGLSGLKVSISLFLHEKAFIVVPIFLASASIFIAFKAIDFKKKIYINLLISAISFFHSIMVVGVPYILLIIPMSKPIN